MNHGRSLASSWDSQASMHSHSPGLETQFQRAKESGFSLSKKDYLELYRYAKSVQAECDRMRHAASAPSSFTDSRLKAPATEAQVLQKRRKADRNDTGFAKRALSQSSLSHCVSQTEDHWMSELRQRIARECEGIEHAPAYDAIRARQASVRDDIRRRRAKEALALKPLPAEASSVIKNALSRPEHVVLSEKACIPITSRDLKTLRSPNWLNDEVINFYFELISERSQKGNLPTVHVFNTFFYSKLRDSGYASIKRWTRKVDIFSFDTILIPIHLGIHWCCAEINVRDRQIVYYDSLHGSGQQCCERLLDYLAQEHQDKKGCAFDESGWSVSSPRDIPCQQNGYDCGVFSCVFAEFRSRKSPFSFSQQDMSYFRDKLAYEILTGKLL